MVASKRSSKYTRKLNLYIVSDNELYQTHVEPKLYVLGVARKLVKDAIRLWWWNFEESKKILLPIGCSNNKQLKFGFK
jgi:hypothetical protein